MVLHFGMPRNKLRIVRNLRRTFRNREDHNLPMVCGPPASSAGETNPMKGIEEQQGTVTAILSTALKLNEEKRKYTRIPLQAKVTIVIDDQTVEANLVNLSLNGALVTTDKLIEIDSMVVITILDTATSQDLTNVKAKVVRVMGNGVGLQFQ